MTLSHAAPLFWPRVNVGCGPAEQRLLLTGLHSVADIFCENCKTTLGWKYVSTEPAGCALHPALPLGPRAAPLLCLSVPCWGGWGWALRALPPFWCHSTQLWRKRGWALQALIPLALQHLLLGRVCG